MAPGSQDEFDAACAQLVRDLAAGTPVTEGVLEVVRHGLNTRLATHMPALAQQNRADVVSESLLRLHKAVRAGRVDPDLSPAGYLWITTRHAAVDDLRAHWRREVPDSQTAESRPEGEVADDDDIARLLEHDATRSLVVAAMRLARADGKHELNAHISQWLELAEHLGYSPTTREAGDALGVNASTISRALQEFGEYLRRAATE
jgi:DNA-directed RNA polymerase specialized sigma24 family protein